MWKVYILQCSDNTLYSGITNNLEKRIKIHNKGKGAKYTSGRRPVKLLYSKDVANRSEATKEEKRIKKLNRDEKLKLIRNQKN